MIGLVREKEIKIENVWSKEMDEDYINRCDIGFELMKDDIEMLRNGGVVWICLM